MDTEDACGWCLYGGFCSANSDPCPEPAGVNDTYLKVHFATIVSIREYTCFSINSHSCHSPAKWQVWIS